MSRVLGYLRSSIGKKQLVALTGLGLCGFVLMHMSGNMLLLVGPEAYNKYSHALITNPLLYVAEVGLLVLFVVHIGLALKVTLENKKARPHAPAMKANSDGKWARFGSRSMALTGLVTLAFLVLHLITFKWGTHYTVVYNGVEMRDLYQLVMEKFREPAYVAWYLFSMVLLGVHLSHGFSALWQSLGISNVRQCTLKKIGYLFAIIIAGGFSSQPLYFFIMGSK